MKVEGQQLPQLRSYTHQSLGGVGTGGVKVTIRMEVGSKVREVHGNNARRQASTRAAQ